MWQWVATITPAETVAVADPERYTILLRADGKVQARFDCHRGGGGYTIADGALSFGPLISTAWPVRPIRRMPFSCATYRGSGHFLSKAAIFTWNCRPTAAACDFDRRREPENSLRTFPMLHQSLEDNPYV